MLSNCAKNLAPGGWFILETLGKEVEARDFLAFEEFERGGWQVRTEYEVVDDWEGVRNRWILRDGDKVVDRSFVLRLYSAFEMKAALRKAGFLTVRDIENREYLDFELSRAFAMADHQVAHIYVRDKKDIGPVKKLIEALDGVDRVLAEDQKKAFRIDHPRSGELVAISDPDKWFAYYWWDNPEKAPDFACHIDIHRKPGYDPLELFMDLQTFKIPQTPDLIKGSHGAPPRNGEGMAVLLLSGKKAADISLPDPMKMVDIEPVLKSLAGISDV